MKKQKIKEDDRSIVVKKHRLWRLFILFALVALVLPVGHFDNAVADAATYEYCADDESIAGQARNGLGTKEQEIKETKPKPKG